MRNWAAAPPSKPGLGSSLVIVCWSQTPLIPPTTFGALIVKALSIGSGPRLVAALTVIADAAAACTWKVGRLAYRMFVRTGFPVCPGGANAFMVRLSAEI